MTTSRIIESLRLRIPSLLLGGLVGAIFALACQSGATESGSTFSSKSQQAHPAAAPTAPPSRGAGPTAPPWSPARGDYPLDPAHSFVLFRTTHAGASYTWGRFLKVNGAMKLGDRAEDSRVDVNVDAASVFTGVRKRDEHLRGPDFLDAARFPRITFRSKEIHLLEGGRVRVRGELTLHGVTKPFDIEGRFIGRGRHPMDPNIELVGFHAEFDIRRSDFGMNQLVGPAGDLVRLYVSLEGARKR